MPATSALLQEGRYRLDHPIVENSESTVFNGYDTVRDTKVVVKEIVAQMSKVTTLAQQETINLNFVNQAKMLASVRHDSLVQVEDYFSEIGRQYLVLESIDGDDLAAAMERNKLPFSLAEAAVWADQILDALHYLHNFDPPIIHRHVRPSNIHLLPDGKVKLLAYGTPAGDAPISTSIDADKTESAGLNYSPLELLWDALDSASQKVIVNSYDDRSEKVLKSPPDARSDIYSVGATLYYILTGRVPVDPLERSIEMLEGNPDPLQSPDKLNPSLPAEVSDVIVRAMQIKREERFDSAVIMRQVLRTAISRADERAGEEARELEEAAADLRLAEKAKQEQIQKLVEEKARELEEQKAREVEEEKRRAAEILEQKLREAEELRLAAERRAAEAEQKLKEEESARKAAAEAAIHNSQPVAPEAEGSSCDESVLGLTAESNSLAAAVDETPEVGAFEEAAAHAAEPAVEEAEEVAAPMTAAAAASVSDHSESTFSYEESGSGSKMPMIIGAVVVLIIAAVGGWMFLGSGSAPQQTVQQPAAAPTGPAPAPVVEQPAPAEQQPAAPAQAAVTEEQPAETQAAAPEPAQSRSAAKPTTAKAAKPTEAAKSPEKKKVTVDDLINDN